MRHLAGLEGHFACSGVQLAPNWTSSYVTTVRRGKPEKDICYIPPLVCTTHSWERSHRTHWRDWHEGVYYCCKSVSKPGVAPVSSLGLRPNQERALQCGFSTDCYHTALKDLQCHTESSHLLALGWRLYEPTWMPCAGLQSGEWGGGADVLVEA